MQNKFTRNQPQKLLTLLATISLSLCSAGAFSQTPPPASPFMINGSNYYQVVNNELFQYNPDGSRTLLAAYGDSTTHNLNAIGLNPRDSMIWAYNRASSNFFRLGSGGATEYWEFPVTGVSGASNDFNVGTIDTNGYLYVYQSNQSGYFTIDINPARTTTYLKAVDPLDGTLKTAAPYATSMTPRAISDWAYSPADGFIYSVVEGYATTVAERYRVVRINPRNGTSALLTGQVTGGGFQQPGDGSNWGYGTSFIDASGNFYVFNNYNGIFYLVNNYTVNTAKTATVIHNSGITGNQKNDGAFSPLVSYISSPLPVSLYSFQAVAGKDRTAMLNWTTLSEQNNKGFEVQHSLNGTEWINKGFVFSKAAQGNSKDKLAYNFTDKNPAAGKNLYRLQQLDHDGKVNYSDVSILDFGTNAPIAFHPNPVITSLNIKGLYPGTYIQVTDINGNTIKEVAAILPTLQIDLSNQPSGLYFINATALNGTITRYKVMKQ